MHIFQTTAGGSADGAAEKSIARVGTGVDTGPLQIFGFHGQSFTGAVSGPPRERTAGGSRIGILWRTTLCWVAVLGSVGCQPARADDSEYISNVVSAIYRVEGGDKTKYPYGIKSVKVAGKDEARKVCENTVRNNLARWRKAGAKGEYLDFLADRYCPPSVDPKGNLHWKNNIKKIITCPQKSKSSHQK